MRGQERKGPMVRVGQLFGAGVWVRMQAAYDTWHAEQSVDVSKIKTIEVT